MGSQVAEEPCMQVYQLFHSALAALPSNRNKHEHFSILFNNSCLPVRLSSKGKRKTGETAKSQELAEVVKLLRTVTGPWWSHLPHGAGLSLPLEQAMLRPPLRCTHPSGQPVLLLLHLSLPSCNL